MSAVGVAGCASPGPPRPPSLHLPEAVSDLSASRQGNAVELRFTVPQRTTDNLPIRDRMLGVSVCRGPELATCIPVPALSGRQLPVTPGPGAGTSVVWQDALPSALTVGRARTLVYRVELRNAAGRSSGWSAPAYAVAGAAPASVTGLRAEGTPKGILLAWDAVPEGASGRASGPSSEVLLRREGPSATAKSGLTSAKAGSGRSGTRGSARSGSPGTVWLQAHGESETLDASAEQDVPYRYAAVRCRVVEVDGRKLELRGPVSAGVEVTLRDVFPPPVPTGLSAAPYTEAGRFAVDLVWNPVEDPGLAGYNITRQAVDANGESVGSAQKLNATPVTLPAFHDAGADASVRYRYGVSAVDGKGNESAAATVSVEPTAGR